MDVRRTQVFALWVALFIGLTPICAGQSNMPESTPLHVLLTNDDGYAAPGLAAVRSALLEAGFRVSVVAPAENQSGSSVRITTRATIMCEQKDDGVWAVDGSPADAVMIGVRHVLRDDPPDLVVSGANHGQNLGYASFSGTVGAATTAMYGGIPAIAISVGRKASERESRPTPYPSTLAAFGGAADITVALIGELLEGLTDEEGLLPNHTILNVNYPALDADGIRGVRVVPPARGSFVNASYREMDTPGELRLEWVPTTDTTDTNLDADRHLFSLGYITISVLDGDWDAGELLRESVAERLPAITRRRE